ncbi:MAG: hypothetical protein KDD62_13025 [Bdellovibrionales bacterium]|nr:hypothetical protein [Bdellovibrionales bacterium]
MNFEAWVKFSFDRPVSDPQWYWGSEFDDIEDVPPSLAIEYLSTLFSSPNASFGELTNPQIAQGLWFILSPSSSTCINVLFDEAVSWTKRESCILSIENLFKDFFATRCSEELGHKTHDGTRSPLNTICYMFWDIIPWYPESNDRKVYLSYLEVLERILLIEHEACQESALHGLGHSWSDYPEPVEIMIDKFLKRKTKISPDLHSYAQSARCGSIA